jgi:hypothetical protein
MISGGIAVDGLTGMAGLLHLARPTTMTIEPNLIETPSAYVERMNRDLVVTRYKNGVKVDAAAIAENLRARMSFPGSEPYAVIGIFPEDVDFDLDLLDRDHYSDKDTSRLTRVLAIVAEGVLFEKIAHLYFAYHPPGFHAKVFRRLQEAVLWVDERLEQRIAG